MFGTSDPWNYTREVKDMLDTLNLQMKQRDDEAQREKEDGIKQVRLSV